MMDQPIREKIKKLLALGTSPNQYEANSAITKAKQLMAEHKLSEKDFDNFCQDELVKKESGIYYTTRKNKWISLIASTISENMCCVQYLQTARKSQKHYIVFYGYENDVNMCNQTFLYAIDCVMSYIDAIRDDGRFQGFPTEIINQRCESFGEGFWNGLEQSYSEQKNSEEFLEWGLVMVIPKEASDYINCLSEGSWKSKARIIRDEIYFNKGFDEGITFTIKNKLCY